MAENGSKDNFPKLKELYEELSTLSDAREHARSSEATRGYDDNLNKLTARVNSIVADNEIRESIAAEEICLEYEAERLTNSKEQSNSLKAALAQAPAAEKAVDSLFHNKQAYKDFIIESFGKKGKGRDGLPLDGAREFFASQKARLDTLSKGWGSDAEKALFKARHKMLDKAEKTYANEQRKALGLGLEGVKERSAPTAEAPEKDVQHLAHEKNLK